MAALLRIIVTVSAPVLFLLSVALRTYWVVSSTKENVTANSFGDVETLSI